MFLHIRDNGENSAHFCGVLAISRNSINVLHLFCFKYKLQGANLSLHNIKDCWGCFKIAKATV